MDKYNQIAVFQSTLDDKELYVRFCDNDEVEHEIKNGRKWIKASEKELERLFSRYLQLKFKSMICNEGMINDKKIEIDTHTMSDGENESFFTVSINPLGTFVLHREIEKDKEEYNKRLKEYGDIPI